MALTQEERISISKKIVAIPLQNAAADKTSGQLEVEKVKAKKEDDANKKLMDDATVFVELYQNELERYDGNDRNNLVEQDLIDAADRKLGNFFFPNDSETPLPPSIPDGIWKNFISFAGSKAVGKQYTLDYPATPVQHELGLISEISSKIAIIEAFSDIIRSSGQSCDVTGTCSLPAYTTQATCESATPTPGVWTPGPDLVSSDAAMQAAGTDVINAVQALESFMQTTFSVIATTDTDATRSAQNVAAKDDITNALPVIDAWQTLQDYDTTHGQTTCSGFNSYNAALLAPTKFRAAELTPLKNEITARSAFLSTRISQLNTNLGSITQDPATGDLTSATGFYGQRMRIIDTRLNAMGGSLSKLKGLERGQAAQVEFKKSNDNAAAVYTSVMVASGFRAPAIGSTTIHVLDGSGFSIGDTVYVIADEQPELQTTVTNVQANTITLADKVSQKYRRDKFARLYKVL